MNSLVDETPVDSGAFGIDAFTRDDRMRLFHSPVEHTVSALLVWDGADPIADDAGELSTALYSPGTRRVVDLIG